MVKKRVFKQNYTSLNEEYKFTNGAVATIIKEGKENVKIKVDEKSYFLPYRDFIILTKKITWYRLVRFSVFLLHSDSFHHG